MMKDFSEVFNVVHCVQSLLIAETYGDKVNKGFYWTRPFARLISSEFVAPSVDLAVSSRLRRQIQVYYNRSMFTSLS